MRLSLVTLLLALLLAPTALGAPAPWGTGESRGEDLSVGLAVFAPGSDVPAWWGHAALVVQDNRLNQGRLYNYGMFNFEEFARFAMGRLEFWVDDAPINWTFRYYAQEDRDIRMLWLNLAPEQRLKVARHLANNVLPENRDYLYDHYRDNCSTRLRDAIDLAVGGQLQARLGAPGRMTIREHTRRFTAVNGPMRVLLDFMMNDSIDRPVTEWDESFLPAELERAVMTFTYRGAGGEELPLIERVETIHTSKTREPVPDDPPNDTPWLLLLGVGWAALFWVGAHFSRANRGWARRLFGGQLFFTGFVLGIPGTALVIMWAVTDHTVTFHNENLFLANPLTLALLPLGVRIWRGRDAAAPQRLMRWATIFAALALLGVLVKPLPGLDQNNWNIIALLLPLWFGLAGAAWWRVRSPASAAVTSTEGGPQWRTT